jgi:hypothetical protein
MKLGIIIWRFKVKKESLTKILIEVIKIW